MQPCQSLSETANNWAICSGENVPLVIFDSFNGSMDANGLDSITPSSNASENALPKYFMVSLLTGLGGRPWATSLSRNAIASAFVTSRPLRSALAPKTSSKSSLACLYPVSDPAASAPALESIQVCNCCLTVQS